MPAFQRQYVWNMQQVEKLWDSILLDYPIATFLYWHVDDSNVTSDTYFCNFLTNVIFDNKKSAASANYDLIGVDTNITETAILDGQQRLTSLYLSLFGEASILPKYGRKKTGSKFITKLVIELNKNKITVDEEEYNSKKFDISFTEKIGRLSPTQFELKNILQDKFRSEKTRDDAFENAIANVPFNSKDYARNILQTLYKKIFEEKLIRYTKITDMNQDDALEMFVRFNSGGKALRKSEITMAILEAYWPSSKTAFGELLSGVYSDFDSDFIIRTALMLYGDVVKSNINKKIADELKNNWELFKQSLSNLEKLLGDLKIEIARFSNSWNVLLPIIYYIYYNPNYFDNTKSIQAYLLRAIFFTYFQSGTTGKLQQMKSNINAFDYEITIDMLEQMDDLNVTDGKIEDVLNSQKGSRVAGEVLYYLSLEWLDKNLKYEQDHLHPEDGFNSKPPSVSMEDFNKWRGMRNRIPNLHLLEGILNASKNDMPLISFYNNMTDVQKIDFKEKALIPHEIPLTVECFGRFYEARKKLLTEKIRSLLG